MPDASLAQQNTTRPRAAQSRIEKVCYLVGLALIIVGVAHVVVAVADPRPWLGPLSWRKPVTFGLSFGTVLISITWVTSYLRLADRTRAVLLGVFCVDCGVEVTGIAVQAWRHVPSHFNNTTPFDAAIAYSLAVGGAVLIVTLGSFAVTAFRGRIGADADSAMRLALKAGFGFLIAGLAAGVAMIAKGERLIAEDHRETAYQTAGYLKWFHAITLHAVLVLPALAWLAANRTRLDEPGRHRVVVLGTVVYLTAATVALVVCIVRA